MIEYMFALSALLFALGAYGAVSHRSAVRMLISLELMFNAELLLLVALAALSPAEGLVLALFMIALTASEIGVIISIVVLLFRRYKSLDISRIRSMRG